MAVTILSTPQNYTPSGNPVVFTFSSNQTGQANFSYLIEVYVNGSLQAREKRFPENGIRSRIDVTAYAERATSAPVLTNSLATNAGNFARVSIRVIERFGDPIADGANATSAEFKVFKSKLDYSDFVKWNPADYIFQNGGENKFLSTFPSGSKAYCADDEQTRLMLIANSVSIGMRIFLFDASGSGTASAQVVLPTADIVIMNVGIERLINFTPLSQASFDAATYYEIEITDNGENFETERFRIAHLFSSKTIATLTWGFVEFNH